MKLKFIERVTEFIYLFLLEIYFPIGVKLKTRELSDVLLSIYEFVKISLERIMLFFVGKEI